MGCCFGKSRKIELETLPGGAPQGDWAYGRDTSVVKKSNFDMQYEEDENEDNKNG